jgi:hypothetical protein
MPCGGGQPARLRRTDRVGEAHFLPLHGCARGGDARRLRSAGGSASPAPYRVRAMRHKQILLPVSLVAGFVALAGCGSSSSSNPLAALSGKRLPGTSSEWLPIASPLSHPANVAGTVTPPVQTSSTPLGGDSVAFFAFGSPAAAEAFYKGPPIAARLDIFGILQYRPLVGSTGVPQPSRGLDLRDCLWSGGPGQGGSAGRGTPSGGSITASYKCTQGSSSSMGVATIVQRGSIVVISQSIGKTIIGGRARSSELSSVAGHANNALKLMQEVGVKT